MSRKAALLGIGSAIIVIALSLRFLPVTPAPQISYFHPTQTVTIHDRSLTLEMVSSQEDLAQGLGDRNSMPLDHGMLFMFDQPDRYTFWMRHMRFALDIIWIRDGKVVDIAYNMPPPKSALEFPATYTPKIEADNVLELNAGQAEAYGLHVGNKLEF